MLWNVCKCNALLVRNHWTVCSTAMLVVPKGAFWTSNEKQIAHSKDGMVRTTSEAAIILELFGGEILPKRRVEDGSNPSGLQYTLTGMAFNIARVRQLPGTFPLTLNIYTPFLGF